MLIESESESTLTADPWTLYLYAMRSPATKEKYLMRLGKFLGFLNLQGTIEKIMRPRYNSKQNGEQAFINFEAIKNRHSLIINK